MSRAVRTLPAVTALVLLTIPVIQTGVHAQTAAELTAIKSLGTGFVVYAFDGAVYRADFGPAGYATRKIAPSGVAPTLSQDGKYVAYIVYNGSVGDIMLMNSDGTNVRKLNSTPIPNVSVPNFTNTDKLIYTAGSKSVRAFNPNYGFYPQELWTIDFSGTQAKIHALSGTDSYHYFNELDMHDTWITYRWHAEVFACQVITPMKTANAKNFGQHCGNCFNPTGDMITLNYIPHVKITFQKRTGTAWSAYGITLRSAAEHEHYRWSNLQEWITCNMETGERDLYAVNTTTGTRVRITFESGRTWWANLHLGNVTSTLQSSQLRTAGLSVLPPAAVGGRIVLLNGQRATGSRIVPMLVNDASRHSVLNLPNSSTVR